MTEAQQKLQKAFSCVKFTLGSDGLIRGEGYLHLFYIDCLIAKFDKLRSQNLSDSEIFTKLFKYSEIIRTINPSIDLYIKRITSCFIISCMIIHNKKNKNRLMCYNCAIRPEVKMKKCSGCKCAWYCSDECSKVHWKEHKLICSVSENIFKIKN